MALYGALATPTSGKKVVFGTIAVTTTAVLDLSADLATVDALVVSYQTTPVATNAFVGAVSTSPSVNTLTCRESDLTTGTTAATINYMAIGDMPS